MPVIASAKDASTGNAVPGEGAEAKAPAANFTEWEITFEAAAELKALAEDAEGNVEKSPMVLGRSELRAGHLPSV